MRHAFCSITVLAASIFAPAALLATPGLIAPPDLTIGRNLQGFSGIKLAGPAPADGLVVTVTSDDPTKLLLSLTPEDPGAKSITLKVNADYVETPDFCVQALSDKGAASFTASAPGMKSVKGNVTLVRSAIFMAGPSKSTAFNTTPVEPKRITFYTGSVDETGYVVQQPIAGGLTVNVEVTSSDPKVGVTTEQTVIIKSGHSGATSVFKPAGVGSTTLAMKIPPGFSAPPKMATVTATIAIPGIGLTGEINLGKDLQTAGAVLLGAPAPEGGLEVVLSSADPKKMVLSAKEDELGSGTLTLHVPAGQQTAPYFIQALSESGTVNYSATAPGFRTRTAPVYLAPAGILVVYRPYGPPDRAEVQRDTRDARPFTTSLASKRKVLLTLWVCYLDRDTHRGADITVQRLRPGVAPTVELKSSNPDVATVVATVKLDALSQSTDVAVTPLSLGRTVFSVSTPEGFTAPSNAGSVGATVIK